MGDKKDSIPYQVRINNFLYAQQQKPYVPPTEEEICQIEEVEYTINKFYAESVRPVMELIQMGRIEEAIEKYTTCATVEELEPVAGKKTKKVKVKK